MTSISRTASLGATNLMAPAWRMARVYAATMLPHGDDPTSNGGVTVVSPKGEVLQFLEIDVGRPVPLPSNICFGGADRQTAYITCGGSGLLVSVRTNVPGLKLNFS